MVNTIGVHTWGKQCVFADSKLRKFEFVLYARFTKMPLQGFGCVFVLPFTNPHLNTRKSVNIRLLRLNDFAFVQLSKNSGVVVSIVCKK